MVLLHHYQDGMRFQEVSNQISHTTCLKFPVPNHDMKLPIKTATPFSVKKCTLAKKSPKKLL
jgi:hypothetical protein